MSVVYRCPSCGTTKASSGECEACHEAQVRYFCTGHTPGIWLEASACSQCGARFGDPPRVATAAATAPPVRTRSPAPPRAPARSPAPIPAPRPAYREEERDPSASRTALMRKILEAAIRSRYAPSRPLARARRRTGRGAGGCLSVLVVMLLVFFALSSGAFTLGRALLFGY